MLVRELSEFLACHVRISIVRKLAYSNTRCNLEALAGSRRIHVQVGPSKETKLDSVERYSAIRQFFIKASIPEQPLVSTNLKRRPGLTSSLHKWPRTLSFHRAFGTEERFSSESPFVKSTAKQSEKDGKDKAEEHPPPEPPPAPPPGDPHWVSSYPGYLRRLALSLPHRNLRPPSIEDILASASGFWQRLRIRFRWLMKRSLRRFNSEDYTTFFGWFVLSQTLWLLIGTTTFAGAIFATLNSLSLQHYVAKAISDYLTAETGYSIVFESAIVPKWRQSTISFKNVYVSNNPASQSAKVTDSDDGAEDSDDLVSDTETEVPNHMIIQLDIDSVDVTLSLWRWLDGKGLVKDAVVTGVRGVIDRRHINWDSYMGVSPAEFRHPTLPGSFQLESFQLEDALVTVYQPGSFRPYFVSIFRAEMATLRKQWLFYDLMSAESIVGQFDNCLFSLHKPQSVSRTRGSDQKVEGWKRMSRFRIDGINVDHLKASVSKDTNPLSWIQSGKLDAVLDIRFPTHPSEDSLDIGEIISNITAEFAEQTDRIPGQRELAKPPLHVPEEASFVEALEDVPPGKRPRRVEIDIDLRFRDLKAAVPIWTSELSYVNNAMIRPIVAFINANRTLLPVRCRIVKDLDEFDGSWTLWETGLMDDIAAKTYEALEYHVTHSMNRNIKTVSLWSLQMTATAVLAALRNAFDHSGEGLRAIYS